MTQKITVIRGDGIGPEIMDATLFVLDQLNTGLEYEDADAGLVALEKHGDLMPAVTLESIARKRDRVWRSRSTSWASRADASWPSCRRSW